MTKLAHVLLAVLGLVLLAYGGYEVYRAPSDAARHVGAAFAFVGLCLLPSVPAMIASGVKAVGSALGEAWRSKEPKP